jgi:D-3-phosphoglycerate dehydrogenase
LISHEKSIKLIEKFEELLGLVFPVKRLGESVIGIIGAGRVGLNVIRLLSEFKPKLILINDLKDKSVELKRILQDKGIDYQFVEKEEIYHKSDIVSLHLPLTPKNSKSNY